MTVLPMAGDIRLFTPKDPISALTHLAGAILSIIGMPLLLIKGSIYGDGFGTMVSFAVFMMSMILLYSASTVYHSFSINERVNLILKKIDHMSIFLLIAGSYTPIAMTVLKNHGGSYLLIAVWMVALVGIIFKACWVTCPKWISSIIYIAMGWMILPYISTMIRLVPSGGFFWLLSGGLFYTVGGVIYAVKPKLFDYRVKGFGNHELFHCFVLAGSLCHYLFMFQCLTMIG